MRSSSTIPAALILAAGTAGPLVANSSNETERPEVSPPPAIEPVEMHEPDRAGAADRLAERDGNTIRVGSDSATCDFDSLAIAINNASDGDTILVEQSESLYLGATYGVFDTSLTIRGGYADCTDDDPSGRTVLDADGQGRVIYLEHSPSSDEPMDVVLENLEIQGGLTDSAIGGAGIGIAGRQGKTSVDLINVEVTNNELTTDANGGGIRLIINDDAEDAGRILGIDNDSEITNNSTEGDGGGLACDNELGYEDQFPLAIIGAADIASNAATNGGGIAVNNCRYVEIANGGPLVFIEPVGLIPTGAIYSNVASENGGGLYIEDGLVRLRGSETFGFGNNDHAAHLVANQAERGGGIFATGSAPGGPSAELLGAVVNNNVAAEDGGGVYLENSAQVRQQRTSGFLGTGPCEPAESDDGITTVPNCSRMVGNTAENGHGGGYYVNDSLLDVDRTIIEENSAQEPGSVVYVTSADDGSPGVANFENTLAHDNGSSPLFYAWQSSEMSIRFSTITDNDAIQHIVRGFSSGDSETSIVVISSIIWEESGNVFTLGGTGEQDGIGYCIIGHQDSDQTDFDTLSYYSNINPMLTTVDDKPYFPSNTSPAIDYCDGTPVAQDVVDLTNTERGSPHEGPDPVEPPQGGIGDYDIGAYETEWGPLTDELFQDRFEAE